MKINFFKILKICRIILAAGMLILLTLCFTMNFTPDNAGRSGLITATQFMPDLLKLVASGLVTAPLIGLVAIITLTLLFGRVYCSVICPLGILQDLIGVFKRKYQPLPRLVKLRFGIVIACFGGLAAGIIYPLMLLDPFSFFGRIINSAQGKASWPVLLWVASTVVLLVIAVRKYGRIYCNSLCPAGAILSLLSRYALFKVRIKDSCRNCGRCEKVCKAGCIDFKKHEVDSSRCVMCLNCLSDCPFDAMSFGHAKPAPAKEPVNEVDESKREFMAIAAISALAIPAAALPIKPAQSESHKLPVMPPGALNLNRFNRKCTACHLCVSACPNHIIRPTLTAYGWSGFLQPRLNFTPNPCAQYCNVCSQVCPTGALTPLTPDQKSRMQFGLAEYIKQDCIVVTGKSRCGKCADACPVGAISMIEWQDGLTIPKVDPKLCIGCGGCENICPARPRKAIIVNGVAEQKILDL